MKNFCFAILGLLFLLFHTGMKGRFSTNSSDDFVSQTEFSSEVADFLVNTTDLHLLALRGGEEAIEHGTVADIKAYGELMVKDQTILLAEIKELAQARQVTVPEKLSKSNAEDLAELKTKSGVAFNKAFVKLIHSAHKRGLRDFQKAASKLEDKEVSAFASRHIHTINLELIRIEKIEAKM